MFEKLNNLFLQSQNSLSYHKFKQGHKIAETFILKYLNLLQNPQIVYSYWQHMISNKHGH